MHSRDSSGQRERRRKESGNCPSRFNSFADLVGISGSGAAEHRFLLFLFFPFFFFPFLSAAEPNENELFALRVLRNDRRFRAFIWEQTGLSH